MLQRMEQDTPYIDSHFHLMQLAEKGVVPEGLMAEALEAGVGAGMDIGIDLDNIARRRKICQTYPGFGYTIGLYPSFADATNLHQPMPHHISHLAEELAKRSGDPLLWAVGEIGLDFHWNYGSPKTQQDLLIQQIQLAEQYKLPVIIHNRKADKELYDILRTVSVGGIIHCFSSDSTAMKHFLNLGFYISFAGNLTFKNSTILQEAARMVPLDRLLFETDSPYLSPHPLRGRVNRPAHVTHNYQFFASLRQLPLTDLKQRVYENFIRAIPRYTAAVNER